MDAGIFHHPIVRMVREYMGWNMNNHSSESIAPSCSLLTGYVRVWPTKTRVVVISMPPFTSEPLFEFAQVESSGVPDPSCRVLDFQCQKSVRLFTAK
jgi:hypothetical protein